MSELEQFFARADLPVLLGMTGWSLERRGEVVTFGVTARDNERYRVRLGCDGYPASAPSALFINAEGQSADPRAWPHGDAGFLSVVKPPPNCFLCMPLTREGLAHHNHWKNENVNAWNPNVHTLLDLLNYLQRLLNSQGYLRRGS